MSDNQKADAYEADAYFDLWGHDLVNMMAAQYLFSSGVFFQVGDEQLVKAESVLDDSGPNMNVVRYRSGNNYYFLLIKGDVAIVDDPKVSCFFLDTVSKYHPDEGMPSMLVKKYNPPPRLETKKKYKDNTTNARGEDKNGIPRYYQQMPVRTDGIERYDPQYAVDPNKINLPPTDPNARRRLAAYDDEGNPVTDPPPRPPNPTVTARWWTQPGGVNAGRGDRANVWVHDEVAMNREVAFEQALIQGDPLPPPPPRYEDVVMGGYAPPTEERLAEMRARLLELVANGPQPVAHEQLDEDDDENYDEPERYYGEEDDE